MLCICFMRTVQCYAAPHVPTFVHIVVWSNISRHELNEQIEGTEIISNWFITSMIKATIN